MNTSYKHLDSWKNSTSAFKQQLDRNKQELQSGFPPHWIDFIEIARHLAPKRIVDVGCGAGVYCFISEKLDIDYTQASHLIEDPNGKTDKMAIYDDELAVIELLFAASENNVEGIRNLVAKGIPVHAGDYDSRTALHLAAAEGCLDVVEYLVTHGHPLFVRDRWGATPLDEAKREKRKSVINYLKDFN